MANWTNTFYRQLSIIIILAGLLFLISNKLNMTNTKHLLPPPVRMKKNAYTSGTNNVTEQSNNVTEESNKTDLKYILIWTMEKHWGMEKSYKWSPGQERFVKEGCKENRCSVTEKRTERPINSFDAIFFHQRAFRWKDIPNRKHRKKTQRYVHIMNEAPMHLFYDKTSLKTMDNFFNWTFTYRRNSTFFNPYGSINQVKPHPTGSSLESYINSFGENNTHLASSKNASSPIAWFVSNCYSQSNREDLVKELQKYIGVDVYGGCGTLNCPKDESEKCLQRYRFYLALENAVCEDYITEKFFTIAKYGIIPITLNGAKMSEFAPPNSYINVLDFQNVTDLADYLQLLTNNDTLYASYFWWKDFYSVTSESYAQGYCDICQALHETNEETDKLTVKSSRMKAPSNMYKWWVEDAQCYKPIFSDKLTSKPTFLVLKYLPYLLAMLVVVVIVWTIHDFKMKSKFVQHEKVPLNINAQIW